MSVSYQAVGWNRQKKIYDGVALGGVALFMVLFVGVSLVRNPALSAELLVIRATGMAGFVLLHVVLCIGPLARLDRRFLPLLYNRRHLGVLTFLLGLAHGALVSVIYHGFGEMFFLKSILVSDAGGEFSTFPFQAFGLFALVILFLMAATSHDFWLANLTAPFWKALHMLVYVAYLCLVIHVATGALQSETHPAYTALLGLGVVLVGGLHLAAGLRERGGDRPPGAGAVRDDGWVEVCRVDEIPENRARIAALAGERVAVFRYEGKVSAVSNVCQHQNGPLGEGKIVDGCITCPWHGYQYRPNDGAAPDPFTEKIPTFNVRVDAGRVFVDPTPNPPGTAVKPAKC